MVKYRSKSSVFQEERMKDYWASSAKNIYNLRALAMMAMMVALGAVLSLLAIPITLMGGTKQLSFEYLPFAVVGGFFGPVAGAVFGAAEDIVAALVRGDEFMPVYTAVSVLRGVLFGLILYSPKKTVPSNRSTVVRLCIAKLVDSLVINIFLNTLIEHIYWGLDFWAIALSRVITNGIMFVPQVIVGILVYGALMKNRAALKI